MGFTVYIVEPAGTLCVVVVGCQGDITTNECISKSDDQPKWTHLAKPHPKHFKSHELQPVCI